MIEPSAKGYPNIWRQLNISVAVVPFYTVVLIQASSHVILLVIDPITNVKGTIQDLSFVT